MMKQQLIESLESLKELRNEIESMIDYKVKYSQGGSALFFPGYAPKFFPQELDIANLKTIKLGLEKAVATLISSLDDLQTNKLENR